MKRLERLRNRRRTAWIGVEHADIGLRGQIRLSERAERGVIDPAPVGQQPGHGLGQLANALAQQQDVGELTLHPRGLLQHGELFGLRGGARPQPGGELHLVDGGGRPARQRSGPVSWSCSENSTVTSSVSRHSTLMTSSRRIIGTPRTGFARHRRIATCNASGSLDHRVDDQEDHDDHDGPAGPDDLPGELVAPSPATSWRTAESISLSACAAWHGTARCRG